MTQSIGNSIEEEETELFELWERLNAQIEDTEVLKLYTALFARVQLRRVALELFRDNNAQVANKLQERAASIGGLYDSRE